MKSMATAAEPSDAPLTEQSEGGAAQMAAEVMAAVTGGKRSHSEIEADAAASEQPSASAASPAATGEASAAPEAASSSAATDYEAPVPEVSMHVLVKSADFAKIADHFAEFEDVSSCAVDAVEADGEHEVTITGAMAEMISSAVDRMLMLLHPGVEAGAEHVLWLRLSEAEADQLIIDNGEPIEKLSAETGAVIEPGVSLETSGVIT